MADDGKRGRGRPAHVPTDGSREAVKMHTLVGTPQELIAQIIGVSPKTLRAHYRREIDVSIAMANAKIMGTLFNKAKNGDTVACLFWLKARAGWSEKGPLPIAAEPEGEIVDARDIVRERVARIAAAKSEGDDPPEFD